MASSTRLTDGSMHTTDDVAAMGSQGVVASAAASDDVDWANFQPEPTNYHDEPADDEELELVRKQEAERTAEFEDKEEKERLEAAEKAMSWTAYQSENGKIDHALEAAEEEAADAAVVDDAASEAESSADEDAEAAAAEERYESVAAEEESASASAYASSSSVPSEDAEQEKKHGYRAPATHLTDGSASAADPAPGAPAPPRLRGCGDSTHQRIGEQGPPAGPAGVRGSPRLRRRGRPRRGEQHPEGCLRRG